MRLKIHSEARGITEGEMAREIIEQGLDRLDNYPETPLWMEVFLLEGYAVRGLLLRCMAELGRELGWPEKKLNDMLQGTVKRSQEFGRARIAEIEKMRKESRRR